MQYFFLLFFSFFFPNLKMITVGDWAYWCLIFLSGQCMLYDYGSTSLSGSLPPMLSSVQFMMVSMRAKRPIIMRSIPSLRSFPNVAFETAPVFVWLTMALSRPFKEDRLALPWNDSSVRSIDDDPLSSFNGRPSRAFFPRPPPPPPTRESYVFSPPNAALVVTPPKGFFVSPPICLHESPYKSHAVRALCQICQTFAYRDCGKTVEVI